MKDKLLSSLDYFFVLRPTLFFPVWTVSLAGVWAQERFSGQSMDRISFVFDLNTAIFSFIGVLTLIMGAAFLINQLSDVESDRLNNKLYLIASGAVPIRHAQIESALLLVISIGLLLLFNLLLGICAFLLFLVTGWAYSCRPLLLKNRPWGGLAANFAGAGLIFAYGWLIQGTLSWSLVHYVLPYLFGIISVYLLTTIPDMPGDAATEKNTVAVRYGARWILRAAILTDSIAILLAIQVRDPVSLVATLAAWPFFWSALRQGTVAAVLRTNKYATLILSLLVCWRFPLYLILLLIVYFGSRWYYINRFQIQYPDLRV